MSTPRQFLHQRKYQVYLAAFFLMILPPVPLFFAARQGSTPWIWFLIGLIVLGNLLVVSVPQGG